MKPGAKNKAAQSSGHSKPAPSNTRAELDKIVKAANDVIKIQNTSIAKYVKAQAEKERAQLAQFQNHVNFFEHLVRILTEDDTSTLPNGKKLVDEEKRSRCLAQVKAYADGCLSKEAALKDSEKAFELQPMPEIDLWTDHEEHEEAGEGVSEFDLFRELEEEEQQQAPAKKARA
jgi:hypothetical protein